MAIETRHVTLGQAGGLDERWKASSSSANVCNNLTWDPRGGWRTSSGFRRVLKGQPNGGGGVTNPFTSIGTIWSIHRFSQHNGAREFILFEADGGGTSCTLYALNPSLRTATPYDTLYDRGNNAMSGRARISTPWSRTQSVTWGNRIYLVNGIDMPVVFDGYRCDRAGFDMAPRPPDASEIAKTTATAYDASGTGTGVRIPDLGVGPVPPDSTTSLQYSCTFKVSFVNSRGQESPLSEASVVCHFATGSSTITSGRNFVWLDLPLGGSNVVARRIYRTQNILDSSGNAVSGRATQFFYQQTVEDNLTRGIEVFLDDDQLASDAVDETTLGLWPAGAKFIASFKGTMFLAGMNGSQIQFSAPDSPEVYPPFNILDVGDAHLGPITGMWSTRNALVVLKSRAIYLIKGDPVNGFYSETLTQDTGSLSPRGLVEIPSVGLAFVGQDGIYALRGALENEGVPTEIIHLGTPLYRSSTTWNASAMQNVVAVPDYRERRVLFFIPTIGVSMPTKAWAFHYETREWATIDNIPMSCALNTSDHRQYVMFGSSDPTNHPGIHVLTRGWDDLDGTAIVPTYQTCDLDLGALWRSASVRTVFVYCLGYGDRDLTLNYALARAAVNTLTTATAQDQQYPENQNRMTVFGAAVGDWKNPNGSSEVALWDSAVWGQWRPIVLRFDISTQQQNPMHEFSVDLTPEANATMMEIVEISIEIAGGDLINTKPLNGLLGVGK